MSELDQAIAAFRAAVDALARRVSAQNVGTAIGNILGPNATLYVHNKTEAEIDNMDDAGRIAWVDAVELNPPA